MSVAREGSVVRAASGRPRFSIEAANPANAVLNGITAAVVGLAAGGLYCYLRLQLSPEAWDFHNGREFNPLVLFPYGLTAVAAFLLGRALLDGARVRKFGVSLLETDELFIIGRPSRAVIRTGRNLGIQSDYTLRLVCIERTVTSSIKAHSQIHDRKVWESTHRVSGSTIDSSVGIPVEFDIPADAPPATWPPPANEATSSGVRWALEIKAPTSGLNYEALFRVNVQDARSARRFVEESEEKEEPAAAPSIRKPVEPTFPWFGSWVIAVVALWFFASPHYGDLADALLARSGVAKGLHGASSVERLGDAIQGTPSYRAALSVRRLIAAGMPLEAAKPVLAERLRSISSSQGVASQDLGMAGSLAVPWLTVMLESDSARVRRDAAFALGDIGRAAASAGPALSTLAARTPPDESTIAAGATLTSISRTGGARLWHDVPFQAVCFLTLAGLFLAYALVRCSSPRTTIIARLRIRQDTPVRFLAFAAFTAAACLLFSVTDLLGAQWTLPADAWALFLGTVLMAGTLHDLANRRDHQAHETNGGSGPGQL